MKCYVFSIARSFQFGPLKMEIRVFVVVVVVFFFLGGGGGVPDLGNWTRGGIWCSGKSSRKGGSKMLAIRWGCVYFFLE